MDLPAVPQVVLFCVGAVWFVAAAPFRAQDGTRGRAVFASLPHVVMMAAMAWMVAAMASSGRTSGGTGSDGAHDMAGMDMSGGSGLASTRLTGAGPVATAILLAIVLGGLGLVWLTRALDRARNRHAEERRPEDGCVAQAAPSGALAPACHAAMALGMAVMLALFA